MGLTEILAVYATILSTIVFIWNILRSTPRFKVDLVMGIEEINGEVVSGVHISIKNPSAHTVHISNVSILYPCRQIRFLEYIRHAIKYRQIPHHAGWVHSDLKNYDIDDECPISLEPGKSHGVLVPETALENIFKESTRRAIKAVAQDQLWRNKYSEALEYPVVPDKKQDVTHNNAMESDCS